MISFENKTAAPRASDYFSFCSFFNFLSSKTANANQFLSVNRLNGLCGPVYFGRQSNFSSFSIILYRGNPSRFKCIQNINLTNHSLEFHPDIVRLMSEKILFWIVHPQKLHHHFFHMMLYSIFLYFFFCAWAWCQIGQVAPFPLFQKLKWELESNASTAYQ